MKKPIMFSALAIVAAVLLGGCAWEVGGGTKHTTVQPTVGQQLIDLQKAKDTGAISEAEFQEQKAKLLQQR